MTRPARGAPTGWSPWPTTRPPAGGGSTAAGSRRRGRTCWPRSCCGPACGGERRAPVHRGGGAGGGRRLPARSPGSSRCSSGPTTCWSTGPSWPASWPRPSSPGGALAAVVVGHRDQRGLARARRRPGAPAWTTWADRRSRWTAGSSSSACWARLAPGARCSTRRAGGAALADEVRRRCATLGQQVRVTLAGEELTGRGRRHRRRRPPGGRDGGGAPARERRRRRAPAARLRPGKGLGAWANIARTMRLLVTGGAGFIGSNFARYWVEQHPEDHVVVYDVLTYAGNRPNLSDIEDRIVFVQGDICDPDAAEKALRGEEIDTIVHFAAESHNSLAVLEPGPLLPDQRARDPDHARGGPPGRRGPLPPRLDLRGLRGPAARHRRGLHRGLALPAPHALQRLEGGGRPRGAGLRRDLRAAHHHHQLRQQLRPLPVPREADPALLRAGARRPAAHALRQHREPPGVAARVRPLHGHRRRARPGHGGRDVPRRQRRGGLHHGGGRPDPRRAGQAGVAQDDRARPPRSRPPLRARRLQAAARAGLGAVGRVGAGPGRHRGVVRRRTGTGGSRCGPGRPSPKGPGEPEAAERCGS